MSEVTKIYPTLKLMVFVDDIKALVKGKNKEVAEMTKNVAKQLKEEVEKKVLKLLVTENGKEGNSKMIASCGFLEDADSVETLGVDLGTRVKGLGAKEKARRKKCKVRFSMINKNEAFRRNYMKVGVKKLPRAGMMPART